MKTISGILLFVFLASGIYADNQVVGQKYKNKPIGNDYLGIVSLSVNGKIDLKFLGGQDLDGQQTMFYGKLLQELPRGFQDASSCTRTEMCTTAVVESMSPHTFHLDHNEIMNLNLPSRVRFAKGKDTWPRHYLVIEITEVHDDSSFRRLDVSMEPGFRPSMGVGRPHVASSGMGFFAPGPDMTVKDKEKPEECLHFACKYAFVDCSNNELVCYGTVSAEGCSASDNRDGPKGVWSVSVKELVKEIVDNTPFQLK
jgi:hypothetical protein